MAFSASEKLKIAKIAGVFPTVLDAHLTSLGARLTADVETAVRTELTAWTTAETSPAVKIHPTESNYGAETMTGTEAAEIKTNLAVLLEIDFVDYGSIGTLEIGR